MKKNQKKSLLDCADEMIENIREKHFSKNSFDLKVSPAFNDTINFGKNLLTSRRPQHAVVRNHQAHTHRHLK